MEKGQVTPAAVLIAAGQPFVKTGGVGSTVVAAVPVLLLGLESGMELAAVTELVITVPWTVPLLTFTTIWNVAVSPLGTVLFENTTLPVPPVATESVRAHPGEEVLADTNVVLGGTGSVTVVLIPGAGPLLMKLIV